VDSLLRLRSEGTQLHGKYTVQVADLLRLTLNVSLNVSGGVSTPRRLAFASADPCPGSPPVYILDVTN